MATPTSAEPETILTITLLDTSTASYAHRSASLACVVLIDLASYKRSVLRASGTKWMRLLAEKVQTCSIRLLPAACSVQSLFNGMMGEQGLLESL